MSNKIIIVGAGLSGLTLANSLKKQGIPFEIYEREASFDARAQGWSISIHFALEALKQCVPEKEFENFSQKVSVNQESKDGGMSFSFIHANTGAVGMSNTSKPGTSYRVHRSRFRNWLLSQVQEHVHWNKKVDHYQEDSNEVTVFFQDGTQATGSILVGADGVMSPIARQLLGPEKFDELTNILDVRAFGVLRWATEEEWNKISKEPTHLCVLNGQQMEDDDIKHKTFNMFCSIHDIDRSRADTPYQVFWSLSRYDPEGVIPKFEDDNTACLELMKAWARNGFPADSPFRQLILDTPQDTKVTPLVIRERSPTAGLTAAHRVVLIGDSAHPMTMFKGEGGNHAIVDAAKLAVQLGEYYHKTKSNEKALSDYYEEMIPRGQKAVKESHDAAIMVHCNPEIMTKMFKT
ncbi:hypothetical protein INT47_003493, partial [Mucor saturninus]